MDFCETTRRMIASYGEPVTFKRGAMLATVTAKVRMLRAEEIGGNLKAGAFAVIVAPAALVEAGWELPVRQGDTIRFRGKDRPITEPPDAKPGRIDLTVNG